MEIKEAIKVLTDVYSMELAEPAVMEALELAAEQYNQIVGNTEILMFIVGWQGGTVHQLAKHLGVTDREIMRADYKQMQDLMRLAQSKRVKYLGD